MNMQIKNINKLMGGGGKSSPLVNLVIALRKAVA